MKKILSLFIISTVFFIPGGALFAERLDQNEFEKIVTEAINQNPEIQKDQQIIQEKAQEVRDVEERIDILTDKISTLVQEEQDLETYISGVTERISRTEEEIVATEKEIDVVQLEIEILTREIDEAEKEIEAKNAALADILQEMYMRDQLSPLEITVGSSSLSEFFSQQQYTDRVRSEVQSLLAEVEADKKALEEKQTQQTEKKATLAVQKETLNTQQYLLEEDQRFKGKLLEDTKNSEKKFQEILRNAREEEARLNEEISTFQGQVQAELDGIRSEVEAKLQNDPNVELTGREKLSITDNVSFIWPASGPITCAFHCDDYPFEWAIGPHSGTDIGLAQGTPVIASATGEVTQVAYPVDSGLAYVVISHGGGFSTAYLHLSEISVSIGDFVEQGEVIGLSGGAYGSNGSGYSTGPHLHFEIRKGDLAVNAQDYLP